MQSRHSMSCGQRRRRASSKFAIGRATAIHAVFCDDGRASSRRPSIHGGNPMSNLVLDEEVQDLGSWHPAACVISNLYVRPTAGALDEDIATCLDTVQR